MGKGVYWIAISEATYRIELLFRKRGKKLCMATVLYVVTLTTLATNLSSTLC
jgi:hypothetical protein